MSEVPITVSAAGAARIAREMIGDPTEVILEIHQNQIDSVNPNLTTLTKEQIMALPNVVNISIVQNKDLLTCFVCGKPGIKSRNGNNVRFIHINEPPTRIEGNQPIYRSCTANVYPTLDEALASVKRHYKNGVKMKCPKCKRVGIGRRLQDPPGTWRYLLYHPNSKKCYCHYSTFTEKQKELYIEILRAAKYIESL